MSEGEKVTKKIKFKITPCESVILLPKSEIERDVVTAARDNEKREKEPGAIIK